MTLDPDYHGDLTDGVLLITLPGTDSWTDMIANLRIGRRKVYGCRVNKLDRAEALFVIRKLRREISEAREIQIYGHSRGGAIALQIWWELFGNHVLDVTVTAAKTTGNRRFCKEASKRVKAYRHRGDIIPFLPPWQRNIKHMVFGRWQPFWLAHRVRNYRGIEKVS